MGQRRLGIPRRSFAALCLEPTRLGGSRSLNSSHDVEDDSQKAPGRFRTFDALCLEGNAMRMLAADADWTWLHQSEHYVQAECYER